MLCLLAALVIVIAGCERPAPRPVRHRPFESKSAAHERFAACVDLGPMSDEELHECMTSGQ